MGRECGAGTVAPVAWRFQTNPAREAELSLTMTAQPAGWIYRGGIVAAASLLERLYNTSGQVESVATRAGLFLEYADIVDFEACRECALVNTLVSAPVTTPCEVEDGVERHGEGPCVMVAFLVVVKAEELDSVDIGADAVLAPFQGIDVELILCARDILGCCLLSVVGMIVGLAVD